MTPELDAAYRLLREEIETGKAVLFHAGDTNAAGRHIVPAEERPGYILRAAAHFRSLEATASHYARLPVDIQTFVESRRFLGRRGIVYPAVMAELIELNSGRYVESVLTGGIGSGKTTAALLTMAYQVYVLSCLKDPHRTFGQDPAAELLTVFQSLNARVAKSNDYTRFRAMIGSSPYFMRFFPFDRGLEAEMIFPRRIIVRPLSGSVHAAIGANVLNALIDEVNFMRVVARSAQAADGGVFDQALEMYNGLVRRRKTRFLTAGRLPGMVCLVSSKRYPGEFTDLKIAEARREIAQTGGTRIFVYDKTVFDIKPPGTYGGQRFGLFLGDLARKPRLLEPGEAVADADRHLVKRIPVEFRSEFEHDLLSAIRDIAGASTFALHPFLVDTADPVAGTHGLRHLAAADLSRAHRAAGRAAVRPCRSRGVGRQRGHRHRPCRSLRRGGARRWRQRDAAACQHRRHTRGRTAAQWRDRAREHPAPVLPARRARHEPEMDQLRYVPVARQHPAAASEGIRDRHPVDRCRFHALRRDQDGAL